MSLKNVYNVIGNIGKSIEVFGSGDHKVVKFSVATSEYAGKDKESGKGKYETEWHDVKCFGRTALYVEQNLKVGDLVACSGKKKTEIWEPKDGGAKRYFTTLFVDFNGSVERLSKREPASNGYEQEQQAVAAGAAPEDDEIPF